MTRRGTIGRNEVERVGAIGRSGAIGRGSAIARRSDMAVPDPPNIRGLEPWQIEGVRWLRKRKRALLADDMGLGKTVQVLRALPRGARVIVVCPKSVMLVWREEVAKFRPEFRVSIGELRRPDRGEVLVVSQDGLPDPPKGSQKLINVPLEDVYLIPDECHAFKNDEADRTRNFRRLRAQCGVCWGLTASPMLGQPMDLWGVLCSLEIGVDLFACDCVDETRDTGLAHSSPRAHFVHLCGGKPRWILEGKGEARRRVQRGWIWGNVSKEVQEKLRNGPMLRRSAALLNLPPLRTVNVPVPAPADLRNYLDGQMSAAWMGVDPGELPPFELISEARAALARSRIEYATEWLDNRATDERPFLAFSDHADPILACSRLEGAVAITGASSRREREEVVRRFTSGEARILAMTIDVGGVGLNLQRAQGVLFIDRSYTPELNRQALGRAYRKGQTRSVYCARMVSDHPLDQRLSQILDEKQRLIKEALG